MNAPERIWLHVEHEAPNYTKPPAEWLHPHKATGYVRDDMFAAENARADKAEALASDLQAKLTDCCLQALATDGQAIEALERADKAEALLAEAVEALQEITDTPARRFQRKIARAMLSRIKEAKNG